MKKITWHELTKAMWKFNEERGYTTKGNPERLRGVVVFTEDSFDKPYTEKARSYEFSSDNKAFLPNQHSNSIFADCYDGIDVGVRLDWYMGGKDGWNVNYCYLIEN
jgi:hypothetical protein